MNRSRSPGVEPAGFEPLPAWVEALAEGREPTWTPVVCGLLTLLGWLGPSWLGLPRGAEIAAFAGAYIAGGTFSLIRSVKSLRRRRLDIDLLMLLSALGAGVIGEYAEGAALLFLFSLSNALESRALRRTTSAIESLMELRPDEALRLDTEGNEQRVAADELQPGDLVRVRPGGRIPVDGHVKSGFTAADQAAITGEAEPAEKGPGDPVFSGTINVGGTVEIVVDKLAAESTLSRIIELVEEAREAKAPTQRFIDRFEQGYAATVIFAALAATVVPLLFGETFSLCFLPGDDLAGGGITVCGGHLDAGDDSGGPGPRCQKRPAIQGGGTSGSASHGRHGGFRQDRHAHRRQGFGAGGLGFW